MYQNPNNGFKPTSLAGLVANFQKNFLEKEIEILPGLKHNQYEVVKRVYFYQHNQFESGPMDDQGNPKYFYDLITHRNDQSTKNIDLDTKDSYIKAETTGSFLKSWLLRREYVAFAKSTMWGKKLNSLADDLPDFGTVVWKKIKNKDGNTDVRQVELINLMNDPGAECLADGMVIERHIVTQSQMRGKKSWDQTVVDELIRSGRTVARTSFIDAPNTGTVNAWSNQIDETTPYYELYELWGEIPKSMYDRYMRGGIQRGVKTLTKEVSGRSEYGVRTSPEHPEAQMSVQQDNGIFVPSVESNETVYVMAIVAGIRTGETERVLFCKEADREDFPYKEVHYRRRKGRWLGVGNYEQCFDLIEKANELTNRFFNAMRLALMHLYQTRDQTHVKNTLTDLLDGDLTVSKSEITIIPTEIRGANEYKMEMDRIEKQADQRCNSFEIVTGENLPSGTPFRLGAQQLTTATKLFEYIRENMGLFIEDVFNSWLLPGFAKSISKAHILDLIDDADDIQVYAEARKKLYQYKILKEYILRYSGFPDAQQLSVAADLARDQIAKGPKQVSIEAEYYADQKYSLKVVTTGENDAKKENIETLSNNFQVLAANPAALQDQRLMKILNFILEQTGYSPLEINSVNEAPVNPSLNPANQGGATPDRSSPGASSRSTRVPAGAGSGGVGY